ncbi:hypothetical protein [Parafrankia sp. EUN1f]|uniref:hypothetical protein n=1 Tax=Parafrankia sp. EUN1f TaxID=102897 RepID=UPI0001C4557A|nr:hypothetical protein [Parafrankia sp. EUN1f]EFC86465.1 hypothetical protein FrEUN1fDRAFT_0360 [Parafrankia sp. EUN1f]
MTLAVYPTSALPVKTHFFEGLAALLDGRSVTWGFPGRTIPREWVMVGEITWNSADWAALGTRARDERYQISLLINFKIPGQTCRAVEESAFEVFTQIDEWLRANPFVLYGRSVTAQLQPERAASYAYQDGAECQIEAQILVSARL